MKPARKPEAALCVLREFFRRLKTCFNSAKRCYRAPFQFRLGALAHKATLKTQL